MSFMEYFLLKYKKILESCQCQWGSSLPCQHKQKPGHSSHHIPMSAMLPMFCFCSFVEGIEGVSNKNSNKEIQTQICNALGKPYRLTIILCLCFLQKNKVMTQCCYK